MENKSLLRRTNLILLALLLPVLSLFGSDLQLTQQDTLDSQGLTVLLFHNEYHIVFGDSARRDHH